MGVPTGLGSLVCAATLFGPATVSVTLSRLTVKSNEVAAEATCFIFVDTFSIFFFSFLNSWGNLSPLKDLKD
jgi:hypothetical protein